MKETNRLVVTKSLFEYTLSGLQERSSHTRESAAVWAGSINEKTNDWKAESVFFHHELCDDRATALSLELSETAKFSLYERLSQESKRLVALLHTHPSRWVDLSYIDRENQISSRIGFWSIVVPDYGERPWLIENMGLHIRQDPGWYRLTTKEATTRFIITNEH